MFFIVLLVRIKISDLVSMRLLRQRLLTKGLLLFRKPVGKQGRNELLSENSEEKKNSDITSYISS